MAGTTLNQIITGTAATRKILYFFNNITGGYLPTLAQIDLGLLTPGFPWYGTHTNAHPLASYNAPPHWLLLQSSTPLASVTMLHPTGLCYNAPPHWPLLQCSTPLASVTMLHPCLRMTVSLQATPSLLRMPTFPDEQKWKRLHIAAGDVFPWHLKRPTMLPRWLAPHPGRVPLLIASWISLCPIKG